MRPALYHVDVRDFENGGVLNYLFMTIAQKGYLDTICNASMIYSQTVEVPLFSKCYFLMTFIFPRPTVVIVGS